MAVLCSKMREEASDMGERLWQSGAGYSVVGRRHRQKVMPITQGNLKAPEVGIVAADVLAITPNDKYRLLSRMDDITAA